MTKLQLTLFGKLPEYSGHVTKHPAYSVWSSMVTRCHNPKADCFPRYGGRGIRVCKAWRTSSRAFVAWAICNGYQPGLQIDRIDNNRGYNPRNCRFVTCRENLLNRGNTVRLADGTPRSDAALVAGLNENTVRARVNKYGWSPDQAVSIPAGGKRPLPDGFKSVGDAAARVVAETAARVALDKGQGPSRRVVQGNEAQRPVIPRGLLDVPCPNLDRPSYDPGYPAAWLAKRNDDA